MIKSLAYLTETLLVAFLLLLNVLMGFYTRGNIGEYSLIDSINNTITIHNIIISLIGGSISTVVFNIILALKPKA